MKANLRRPQHTYYDKSDLRVDGVPPGVRGDLSGIVGDLSGIEGDLTGIRGNLSGIRGNLSGIRGDLTDTWGNVDDCEITDEDRKRGISIEESDWPQFDNWPSKPVRRYYRLKE